MQVTYSKETDLLNFVCPNCNKTVQFDCSDFTSGIEINPLGQEEYNDLIIECPCGATTYFNMKIPEGEYDELDLEENVFTFEQINMRKQIRDLMWKKRADLSKINRNKFNEEKLPNLPNHIQLLVKRNNMMATLIGNAGTSKPLTEEQTNVLKVLALQVISAQVSILKAIIIAGEILRG